MGNRVRARLVLVGATCALILLGVVGPLAASALQSPGGQPGDHGSYVVQHEATVVTNASSPARSHRLALPGAFVVVACFAAIAARRMASRGRTGARRRLEQFHVRLRGPPALLLVAH